MLPRTYLSNPFPYLRRGKADAGFPGGSYRGDPGDEFYIAAQYDERPVMIDGLWDDGERLVMITWLDQVWWPGWDIVLTYWDRTSGTSRGRVDLSMTPQAQYKATTILLEDPERDFLSTQVAKGSHMKEVVNFYLRGFGQDKFGNLWAHQSGYDERLMRMELGVSSITWGYDAYPELKGRQTWLELERAAADPRTYGQQPSTTIATDLESGPVFGRDLVNNPITKEEVEANVAAAGGDDGYLYGYVYETTKTNDVAKPIVRPPQGHVVLDTRPTSTITDVQMGLDGFFTAWLVLDASLRTVLLNPFYSDVPNDVPWNGAALVSNGSLVSYTRLPDYAVAFVYDDETRVWALLNDNTVVCFDYETNEILAYFWLPIPYKVSYNANARLAWQKDYRRLLVVNVLPGYSLDFPRNRYDTRITGYSTTPLPVHVCTPIPLRPVRAGRPTPFLIKQVGSLGEPLAGLCMLTPGAGVTVDRLTVPLDNEGEAHVMVTASAEGEATLTASIDVIATWDKPGIQTPFGNNADWIEGT